MSERGIDVVALFDSLPLPNAEGTVGQFSAQQLAISSCCYVAKDAKGAPALLVATHDPNDGVSGAPLLLEWLRVVHSVPVSINGGSHQGEVSYASLIACTAPGRDMQEYFLRVLLPIAAALPPIPHRTDVDTAVATLVELFRYSSGVPKKTIAGLWAELFVIAFAVDPTRLIQAWRATPQQDFDFAQDDHRLEVKSSAGRRVHQFSLTQLRPPAAINVAIASVLTQSSQGGASIVELVNQIRSRVSIPDLLIRVDTVVADTLGTNHRAIATTRFDIAGARHSLRFFGARLVPAVSTPIPPEVSGVHFQVDMTHIEQDPTIASNTLHSAAQPIV